MYRAVTKTQHRFVLRSQSRGKQDWQVCLPEERKKRGEQEGAQKATASHNFYQLPTGRVGKSLQRQPLPGRLCQRKSFGEDRVTRGPNSGKEINFLYFPPSTCMRTQGEKSERKPYFAVKFLISPFHLPLHCSKNQNHLLSARGRVICFCIDSLTVCLFWSRHEKKKEKRKKTAKRWLRHKCISPWNAVPTRRICFVRSDGKSFGKKISRNWHSLAFIKVMNSF